MKCMRRPTGVDLYEDALSWTPFRTAAHARSAGRRWRGCILPRRGSRAAPKASPAGGQLHHLCRAGSGAEMERYLCGAACVGDELRRTRATANEALELLAPFHAELLPLLPALTPLWTHNDLHASNLLWSDAGDDAQATAIIDFGLADRTNAVHDLAHAIERNIVEWLELVENPRT